MDGRTCLQGCFCLTTGSALK
uniref:Uncharacterized protein n=1 Tax=Arundo donax TaxID=35708 RepID=A0A0A8ZGP5_ARUDO